MMANARATYRWKSGAQVRANAEAVGAEIEQLRQRAGGVLEVGELVDAARNPTTELHHCFDWNDASAAEKHREEQARYILRSLVVSIEVSGGAPVVTRAFVAIEDQQESGSRRGYVAVVDAIQRDEWRDQIIGRVVQTLHEARHLMKQYETLVSEFGPAQTHLQEALAELESAAA